MWKVQSDARYNRWIAFCALLVLVAPWSLVRAGRAIQERRAAEPQGEVEIINVSGAVEVLGWDRSEVEVNGTAGDNVERVDVAGGGNRTSITVVSRSSRSWGSDGEAHLVIHVPAKSAVTASLISADFKTTGVAGDMKVQTVSGNLSGEVGGNVRATTVSGDVRLTARAAKSIEIQTINGNIHLTGGGGEVAVTTVNGTATLELGDVSRGRFKSVSGDLTVSLALLPDGRIESESISGDVSFKFATAPAAEFDVQTLSGDINSCFGPKPAEPRFGPGSRLSFKNGEGHGSVRINTKSGDVRLCAKDTSSGHTSALSLAQTRRSTVMLPYVF